MYSGIAKASSFDSVFNHFFQDAAAVLKLSNTKFFAFVLETLFAFGKQDYALGLIKEAYRYNKQQEEQLFSKQNHHIFPIMAANYLIRELLGVRPAVPGMGQIYFNPACRVLSDAKGRIPNANGKIVVEWKMTESNELVANIDSNHPLDVLPLLSGIQLSDCTFNLGNYVNLLDSGSTEK